jgi:polar amino acid transport system substrate-binding protein
LNKGEDEQENRFAWASLVVVIVPHSCCRRALVEAKLRQADPFANIKRIQTAKVLKVGTGAGYYPFEMLDKSGKIVGFDMDIAQAMADSLGVELEVVDFKDFDAILPALGAGQIDMILAGMTITPQRAQAVNFSQPYFQSGQSVLVNNKHKDAVTTEPTWISRNLRS